MISRKKKVLTKYKKKSNSAKLVYVCSYKDIKEYRLNKNNLKVLFVQRPTSGVITSNLVYHVGSRDEARGETGIAHMLEHMLFKPTIHDKRRHTDSASMKFEREVGCILNANTWKDRTSYFFSYPKEYFEQAIRIEAERIHDVLLTDNEFVPEQGNVLSEFDMYEGDEQYSLTKAMLSTAFMSHPYGHETIGFREDIEDFTSEKLHSFYRKHYTPENATLIIVGDVTEKEMETVVCKHFGCISMSKTYKPRAQIREPRQEGIRTVTIERGSKINIFALGIKHAGFPSASWFNTHVVLDILAGEENSIFHRLFVDTGLVVKINVSLDPCVEESLAIIFFTLAKGTSHEMLYKKVQAVISSITVKDIKPYLQKIIAKTITKEQFLRESSLGFASELVEYVSAGSLNTFYESEKILKKINEKEVLSHIKEHFTESKTVLGYVYGHKKV